MGKVIAYTFMVNGQTMDQVITDGGEDGAWELFLSRWDDADGPVPGPQDVLIFPSATE